MGLLRTNAGGPIEAALVSNGTIGTPGAPAKRKFITPEGNDSHVSPCLVYNRTGNGDPVYVKINNQTTFAPAAGARDGVGHILIEDGEWKDVSLGGLIQVSTIWMHMVIGAGNDFTDVEIHGWLPGGSPVDAVSPGWA